MLASRSHLVLIPSYNPGRLLRRTVQEALAVWSPVWVVVDGSTDGSGDDLPKVVRVLRLPRNAGKGAAVRHGLQAAAAEGFSHALVMDADGQHPAERVAAFMAASAARPDAMVLGRPVFGPDAPRLRVHGRRLSNWCAALETGVRIGDSLFGFRVYPIPPLLRAMAETRAMRGFDFDPEAMVRLCWAGVPAVVQPAPVRYFRADQGGVSHFRYWRDNLLLIGMHLRLGAQMLARRRRQALPAR